MFDTLNGGKWKKATSRFSVLAIATAASKCLGEFYENARKEQNEDHNPEYKHAACGNYGPP